MALRSLLSRLLTPTPDIEQEAPGDGHARETARVEPPPYGHVEPAAELTEPLPLPTADETPSAVLSPEADDALPMTEAADDNADTQHTEGAPGATPDQARTGKPGERSAAPLFILGNAPTAADRVAYSLIHEAHMAGTMQGRLLPLAQQLIRVTGQFYRQGLATAGADAMIRHIDAAYFQRGIRRMFARAMAEQFPQGVDWLDNTPGLAAIQSVATMRAIWPKARFIFIGSRMMESVAARGAADPGRPLREHVGNWTREMQAWSEVRDRVGKNAITIDQFELHHNPGNAAFAIADLLALDAATSAALTESLTQGADDAGHAPPPLLVTDLPRVQEEDVEAITSLASPMMAMFGYGWESYFSE